MKNIKILVLLAGLLIASSTAMATNSGSTAKKNPFPNRAAFLTALFDAGFNHVFEFKANASQFSVLQASLDSKQQTKVKKLSMGQYVQTSQDWERVPALDYVQGSLGHMNVMGIKFGSKRFEAYKVGGFAICHRIEDGYAFDFNSAIENSGRGFDTCIAVPMDVNEVIERLELRGLLD
jgi:hypothetical protein